jgi:hypothetical protein
VLATEEEADALTVGRRHCCVPLDGSWPGGATPRRSPGTISAATVKIDRFRNVAQAAMSQGLLLWLTTGP